MKDAAILPAAEESTSPVTLDDVKRHIAKIVNELHTLNDNARELDDRDGLPFDLYMIEDLLNEAEKLSNIADGIE